MFNQNANTGFSAKFLNRMFRKVDGLVWDLQTGTLGIRKNEGIYTLTTDTTAAVPASGSGDTAVAAVAGSTTYGTSVNPFEVFSMAIPAFATQVPLAGIKEGDMIVGDRDILGWVIGRNAASLKLLDANGFTKNYTPPKVAIMGQDGALVVQSLGGLFGGQAGVAGLQSSLLPLLMLGDGATEGLDSILPIMLFSQMQATNPAAAALGANAAGAPAAAANPMASMLPMLMMQKLGKNKGKTGGKSGGLFGDIDPMMLMMMSGGFGGGAGAGGINPMMLLAMGGLGGDDDEAVGVPSTNATYGTTAPALQRIRRN